MPKKIENCIYIVTNPQYPGYVKIGYASDLRQRITSLNTGALIEFSPYAVYETPLQNADREIHAIIALLNPILRASKFDKGKAKGKEFFKLEPEEAFSLFQLIARVSGTERRAYRVTPDYKPIPETARDENVEIDLTAPEPADDGAHQEKQAWVTVCGGIKMADVLRLPKAILFADDKEEVPFTAWTKYAVKVCEKALALYGEEKFAEKVLNPEEKLFHTKKRDTFARTKEEMRGFDCTQIGDRLWFLTNYSAESLRRIAERIMELFPKARAILRYE